LSEIRTRLGRIPREHFLECLKKPKETQYHLIKELSKTTHPKGQKYKARMNLSFASKFCHYACFYLFEGKKAQDNYSIYDNIVRKVLPRYCGHFGVVRQRLMDKDYVTYQETIDAIIKASGGHVSRNGFDHLLWYYFKGRI